MCTLLDDILKVAVWKDKDDFPYDSLFQVELQNWLQYAKSKGWYDEYLPRLTKMDINKRDEALDEILAAYFLEEKMHFVVKDREPKGANGKRGEFILVAEGTDILCEVKSPGWESEIVKKEGVHSSRLKTSKYLPVEARWGDDSAAIKATVDKSYEKLPNDKPSLLIIVDDFWRSLFQSTTFKRTIYHALYYEDRPEPCKDPPSGYFATKDYENLSGILFLKSQIRNNDFIYSNRLCLNKYALYIFPSQLLTSLNVEDFN